MCKIAVNLWVIRYSATPLRENCGFGSFKVQILMPKEGIWYVLRLERVVWKAWKQLWNAALCLMWTDRLQKKIKFVAIFVWVLSTVIGRISVPRFFCAFCRSFKPNMVILFGNSLVHSPCTTVLEFVLFLIKFPNLNKVQHISKRHA